MVKEYSLKKDGEMNLSENFKVKEFACKDGSDKILIDDKLIDILQKIRYKFQKPVKIISGYRTESYNNSCGGAKQSQHLLGRASDIMIIGEDTLAIGLYAEMIGAKGVGAYKIQNYTHIDTRELNDNTINAICWINFKDYGTQQYYKSLFDYISNKQPTKEINI